jgi:hypothetical protein
VSHNPIILDKDRLKAALLDYKIDGRPVLDLARGKDRSRLDWILRLADGPRVQPRVQGDEIERLAELLVCWKNSCVVTDDNMGTEWQ